MAAILFVVDGLLASSVRELLRGLCLSGHDVRICARRDLAIELCRSKEFDAFLLSHGIARADGSALLAALRAETDAAILILVGGVSSAEKATMLNRGADGCLTKPYTVDEVDAFIQAILRRRAARVSEPALDYPPSSRPDASAVPVELQVLERRVLIRGAPVRVTPTEAELLRVLIAASGKVVPWSELRKTVWGAAQVASIDPHVSRLRIKLAPEDWRLDTVRGVGLRFVLPASASRRPISGTFARPEHRKVVAS